MNEPVTSQGQGQISCQSSQLEKSERSIFALCEGRRAVGAPVSVSRVSGRIYECVAKVLLAILRCERRPTDRRLWVRTTDLRQLDTSECRLEDESCRR